MIWSLTRFNGTDMEWNANSDYVADRTGSPSGNYAIIKVGARYLDQATGSFLTRDSDLDQSPYAYCDGDPVNGSDPSGHKPKKKKPTKGSGSGNGDDSGGSGSGGSGTGGGGTNTNGGAGGGGGGGGGSNGDTTLSSSTSTNSTYCNGGCTETTTTYNANGTVASTNTISGNTIATKQSSSSTSFTFNLGGILGGIVNTVLQTFIPPIGMK